MLRSMSETTVSSKNGLEVPPELLDVEKLNHHTYPPSLVLGAGKGNIPLHLEAFPDNELIKISPKLTQGEDTNYAVEKRGLVNRTAAGRINFPRDSEQYLFAEDGEPPFELYAKKEGRSVRWYVVAKSNWTEGRFRNVSLTYSADEKSWNPALAQDSRGQSLSNHGDISNGFNPGPARNYSYQEHKRCEVPLRESPEALIPILPGDTLEFRVKSGTVEEGAFVQIRF